MSSSLSEHEKRAVTALCDLVREKDPRRAIGLRAEKLVADFGRPSALQTPRVLAQAQGIVEIVPLDISFDACLIPIPKGFRIEVCRFHSAGRQNFSIAHEIGHTFLIELNPVLRSPKRETGFGDANGRNLVEQLCDVAAAELVWPAKRFSRDAWELGPSLLSVLELAKRYRASVTGTARRLAEVGPWKCHFIVWEYATNDKQTGRLSVKATYRSPFVAPLYRQDFIIAPHSQFQLAVKTNEILRGREAIMADGEQCYMESVRLGRGDGAQVLTLLLVEPHAEYLARPKRARAQLKLFVP